MAAVNLPDSAADLSARSLLCLKLFARNSCRDASCSLWNAVNWISTSDLICSAELFRLPLLLSPSLSLSLLLSLLLSPSLSELLL